MTIEKQAIYPIVITEKLTFDNFLRAILDSPVTRTRIRIGTVGGRRQNSHNQEKCSCR